MKKFFVALLVVITILLWALSAQALERSVIVQQRDCHRVWNSSDTITMTMSESSWDDWKRDHQYRLTNKGVRYIIVSYGERHNLVKHYDWIIYKHCK